jgi:thiol-disulfide isomerase/thioredoxin
MRSRILVLLLSGIATLVPLAIVMHSAFLSLSNPAPQSPDLDSAAVTTTSVSIAPQVAERQLTSLEDRSESSPSTYRPVGRPIEVSERQYDRLAARGLVLVKFGAEWCGPCVRVDSELRQLAQDNAGELTVLTVNIDREKRLSQRYDVGPIPHMILLRDGQQVEKWTGYKSASRLQKEIDQAKPAKGKVQTNPFTS